MVKFQLPRARSLTAPAIVTDVVTMPQRTTV